MNRKVKISLILIGKSHYNYNKSKELNNEEILSMIENQIVKQFGERPLFVVDRESITFDANSYPKFYAAGWFTSDDPITDTSGIASELVIVAHGEDMKTARTSLMNAVPSIHWDNFAKNIHL